MSAYSNQVASTGDSTQLEMVAERIGSQRERGYILADRISNILSRLRGELPEAVGKSAPQPVRCGLIGRLEDTADGLASLGDLLESQIDELNRLV